MVTLYDVARRAAVSTATVSRVVHGQDRVREATRIRVQQAIEELGYVPDGAGQSLSRRRKDIIGMLCVEREKTGQHDIETECLLYYDEVQRGVQERIRGSQWLLLSTFMQADGTGEPGLSGLDPLSGKVDGILVGEGFAASRRIQRLAARLPVVVIAGTLGAQAADVVAADNFSGAAALITHLIAGHGRRRLFHVGGPPDSPDAIQRRLAFDHVLRGHPHCQLIGSAQGIFSIASGEQVGDELLARHRAAMPDAVVCANDQMAIGVLRALSAADVRVPGEVAVTGFDHLYPARLVDPPLSTVRQPMRMLGQRACARLLDRIAHPGLSPAVQLLPTELVLRSSCGCPARDAHPPACPSPQARLSSTSKRRHLPVPAPVAQCQRL
jgi:LacI family transcriptional regulator, galactose operon repressor